MDNHKKSVLWIIDIAKLMAVVCGATLLGILFVKVGFPETKHHVDYSTDYQCNYDKGKVDDYGINQKKD